jgi:phosphosulfolactate synthase
MGDVAAEFLSLSQLPSKPRTVGLTHVIDPGLTLRAMVAEVEDRGEWIDIWKFGWGTAYLEPRLVQKVAVLNEHGITPCLGGTLLEVAFARGVVRECLDWAADSGFVAVEVSRGSVPMSRDDKRGLIENAASRFTVLAETGFKRADQVLSPSEWFDEVTDDLASGATLAVAEGRESGTIGLYDSQGKPLVDVVDAVVAAAGLERAIFEAPVKAQQSWFINRYGPLVNLGNVAAPDVIGATTLRLGLRADTLALSAGELTVAGS